MIKIWFVSRHVGAINWMRAQKEWKVDYWVEHLDIQKIKSGDIVIGILPLYLAAAVCAKGAKFYALNIPLKRGDRGVEQSAQELIEMGSYLQRYNVQEIDD